jgi:hypothetical protein
VQYPYTKTSKSKNILKIYLLPKSKNILKYKKYILRVLDRWSGVLGVVYRFGALVR